MHVDPEEAIKIHYDLKSKMSFGIHWAAFKLTLGRLIYEFQTFCLSRNLFTFFTKTKYKMWGYLQPQLIRVMKKRIDLNVSKSQKQISKFSRFFVILP